MTTQSRAGIMALLDAYEDAARNDSLAQTPTTIDAVREARRAVLRYAAAACPVFGVDREPRREPEARAA